MKQKIAEIFLPNEDATINFGARIAKHCTQGMIFNLVGELGAGKTSLAKGILMGLGWDPETVTSPTFTLVNEYQTGTLGVLHCDFYRLSEGDPLDDLGGLEFFFQKKLYIVE